MKIVIDPDKLLQDGRITADEYARIKSLAIEETSSLAFNILIGFGVMATAGGTLALLPSMVTTIGLGSVLALAGINISQAKTREWDVLGVILLLVGAVTLAGGILALDEGSPVSFLSVTVLLSAGAVLARSGLLTVLAVLALSGSVGAMTSYHHATYFLIIHQPLVTAVLFSVLGVITYQVSKRLTPDYQRLAILAARTSLFLVNFGLWVGSLWGDSLGRQRDGWGRMHDVAIPAVAFAIIWALALIGTGIWGVLNNKRWVVNLLTVFMGIHFYTQVFEHLGATPGTILVGGLVALGIGIVIAEYNKAFKKNEPS